MPPTRGHAGFSVLEVATSLGIIVVLLAVLLPALSSARHLSHLQTCSDHCRAIGEAFELHLNDHDQTCPFVPIQPAWHYGGVRHSAVTGEAVLDYQRPLNLSLSMTTGAAGLYHCPSDVGVTDAHETIGTGDRTAYSAFGTSFRANASLFDARIAGTSTEARGMRRAEITASPSRLVLLGDPIWYERWQATGRRADWHGAEGAGNILFLDGSIRLQAVRPLTTNQPTVFDPVR